MNGRPGRDKTPWIYRPVRQWSTRTNRIVLVVWLGGVIVLAGVTFAAMIDSWSDIPWSAIPGGILVLFAGLYAIAGLVMLAINKHVFD